jgi:hypothetical protein
MRIDDKGYAATALSSGWPRKQFTTAKKPPYWRAGGSIAQPGGLYAVDSRFSVLACGDNSVGAEERSRAAGQ